jgi:ferredoxin-type protein NapH
LYSLLGRRALLRVMVAEEQVARRRCRHCTLSCPMDIRVMEDEVVACHSAVGDPDCTRCGACIDACPERVLGFGVGVETSDRVR